MRQHQLKAPHHWLLSPLVYTQAGCSTLMIRVDHHHHPCRLTSRMRLADLGVREGRHYLHRLLLAVAHPLVQLVQSVTFAVKIAETNWEPSTATSHRGAARTKACHRVDHHQSAQRSAVKANEVIEEMKGEVGRVSTKERIVRERRETVVGGTANLEEASEKGAERARIANGATETAEMTEEKTTVSANEARSDRGIQRISRMGKRSAAGTKSELAMHVTASFSLSSTVFCKIVRAKCTDREFVRIAMALGKEHDCNWEIPVRKGSILGALAFHHSEDPLDFVDGC